jgi:hypothetical protein
MVKMTVAPALQIHLGESIVVCEIVYGVCRMQH